jgi:hypothetical protein
VLGNSDQEIPGYNGAMDAATEQPAQPRRRWFRFSLRTLLIVVTVASVPLGWVGWELNQVSREKATTTWVEKMGGGFRFNPDREKGWWEDSTDKWFGERVWRVDLQNSQVSDVSPLAALKSLEYLSLDNTQVSDLSPLAELENLRELHFRRTAVSDLSPLAKLGNLILLVLSDTQVNDLSPLAELKNLKWLRLHNTQVSDEQVQELRQALPNCEIALTKVFRPWPH